MRSSLTLRQKWSRFCGGTPCSRTTDNGLEYYCCDNFEPREDKCVECQQGFYSIGKGKPCKRCGVNMFGLRCTGICNCNKFLRCDHVKGCVNDTFEKAITDTSMPSSNSTQYNEEYSDPKLMPLFIYLICAAALICLLVVGTIWMAYCRGTHGLARHETEHQKSKHANVRENVCV